MVPFDPIALEAMLRAFYPDATPAAFRQARAERPEYFAGGAIVGSHGDKLQLSDARVLDCIYDVENETGRRHWQVIEPGAADAGGVFALEPGPIAALDPELFAVAMPRIDFTGLVAEATETLPAYHEQLAAGVQTIAENATPAALEASTWTDLEPADMANQLHAAAFYQADPADVIAATAGASSQADHAGSEYDEPVPPVIPDVDVPAPPDAAADTQEASDGA